MRVFFLLFIPLAYLSLIICGSSHASTTHEQYGTKEINDLSAYRIDRRQINRRFDGIGGLSGGGATSRLLRDYEEPFRSIILDILFLPNYAASLQILKVEIGGDAFSGCGTEPSHMHTRDDENYNRGYEWWLMREAKTRNPNIKLYGLPWGFPGWFQALSADHADYIVNWVRGAKTVHNLTIDYVGIWNEKNFTPFFIKLLRARLDAAGFVSTQIVAADDIYDWSILDSLLTDPDLVKAVYAIGAHYPDGSRDPPDARKLRLPLWASEDSSSFDDQVGGGCWARILNWNYVVGEMTATVIWNLISSYYEGLYWYGDSLMNAASPWSGYFEISSPIWVTSHTTQFTTPGWFYLTNSSGAGMLNYGGSYVTLVSADRKDFTIIIETMNKNNSLCIRSNPNWNWTVAPQQVVKFQVVDILSRSNTLHVWESRLFGSETYFMMQKQDILIDQDGFFSIKVQADSLLTLTTLSTGSKGHVAPAPQKKPFPLPYNDNFDSYSVDQMAKYFSDMAGTFSISQSKFTNSLVMRQQAVQRPVSWCGDSSGTLSIIGDFNMTDCQVNVSVLIEAASSEKTSYAAVGLRLGNLSNYCLDWFSSGYYLVVMTTGDWQLRIGGNTTLSGRVTVSTDTWNSFSFQIKNTALSATVNGKPLFENYFSTISIPHGFAGIGGGFNHLQFDNFSLSTL